MCGRPRGMEMGDHHEELCFALKNLPTVWSTHSVAPSANSRPPTLSTPDHATSVGLSRMQHEAGHPEDAAHVPSTANAEPPVGRSLRGASPAR